MKLTNNISHPETGIRLTEEGTRVFINNESKGTGTLFVTENDIVWINGNGQGISLHYPDISLFAVCTDREKYTEDCIFMLVKDEDAEEDDSDSDEDFCDECEIRFAPPGGTDIKDVFNVIQDCNKLHPSTNDDMVSDSEEDNEDDLEDFGVVPNGNSHHAAGQFDDADMN